MKLRSLLDSMRKLPVALKRRGLYHLLLCRFTLIAIYTIISSVGCTRLQVPNDYLVVSSTRSTEKAVFGIGERELILFTLKHRGVIIKTHCQVFDPSNPCSELRVGESYEFERDDRLRYLTLRRSNEDPMVLGIDEEHIQ